MLINILIVFLFIIGLLVNYKKTIFWVACLFPILHMIAGIGPIPLIRVLGIVSIVLLFVWYWQDVKQCPIVYVTIPFIIVCAISNHINERHTPTMLGYISENAFLPIVMWNAVKGKTKSFLKISSIYFLVVCLYGYYEAITNSNPFATWACSEDNTFIEGYYKEYSEGIRYGVKRIQSLMLWRDACGSLSAYYWGLLYYYKTYHPKIIGDGWLKTLTTILMYMLPITVLLTGTRACIVVLLVCMIGTIRKINVKIVIVGLGVAMLAFVFAAPYVDSLVSSFSQTDSVSGSNVDMREQQLVAVLMTLRSSPVFGNGFSPWQNYSLYAEELLGAESLWFQLLLKVGILGTLFYIIMLMAFARRLLLTHTYYALVMLVAFIIGLTLSSLPGFSLPYVSIYTGMMVYSNQKWHNNNKILYR